ncbi:hypothetical protein OG799_04230 [Micromonospora sp. NBC_00898]|uniref:hypothetical protein n=1 Tax=Micromonospora sp. NBC_00898 TaxID=2975981 RepID=UPI0038646A91|nr:hypothetical protein OG799_04230 [Micromonospora sp. NBC_00898]
MKVGDRAVVSLDFLGDCHLAGRKGGGVGDAGESDCVEQCVQARHAVPAQVAGCREVFDLSLEFPDASAAEALSCEVGAAVFFFQGSDLPVDLAEQCPVCSELVGQLRDLCVEEVGAAAGDEVRQGGALFVEGLQRLAVLVVCVAGRENRGEPGDLFSGAKDRVMSSVEVVEVVDELADHRCGVEGFEHVAADEVVEVADCLHRYGLVEQVHCLLGGDAESPAEVLAVLGEVIGDLGSALA